MTDLNKKLEELGVGKNVRDMLNSGRSRKDCDEEYVINLCDEALGLTASRQHCFDFLKGDTGRMLPVDAYYDELKLVVEYNERQHTEAVPLFDNKPTVSGVPRGEQRRIYEERRRTVLPQHGISLVTISYSDFGTSKKLLRNHDKDLEVVKEKLYNRKQKLADE